MTDEDPQEQDEDQEKRKQREPPKREAKAEADTRMGLAEWATKKPVRRAAAGYSVTLVFIVCAALGRAAGASWTVSLILSTAAAAPLVIAFVGERITGIKAFNVEVTLAEVSARVEGDLSGAIMRVGETGGSASPELVATLRSALRVRAKLLRINLRDDDYWWSTRIFLVAALADDYTEVEALVFVRAGEERVFVGIAAPRAVRKQLAIEFPPLEKAYREVRAESVVDAGDEITNIVTWRWPGKFVPSELAVTQKVGSDNLRTWLKGDLDTEGLPYGPLTPLLCFRINDRPHRYSALTDNGRLVAVVDRTELAVRRTSIELTQRLD